MSDVDVEEEDETVCNNGDSVHAGGAECGGVLVRPVVRPVGFGVAMGVIVDVIDPRAGAGDMGEAPIS